MKWDKMNKQQFEKKTHTQLNWSLEFKKPAKVTT
jgi:hypothetical protein